MRIDIALAERLELQRNTLRLLCSVLIKPETRVDLCGMLTPAVFEDPLQRVVFEEICRLGPVSSRHLRELLPARVTNRGFPEFNLKQLLAPSEVSEQEMTAIFGSLFQLLDEANPDA